MTGDLFIGSEDVYLTCGVSMGNNFIQELLKPGPLKAFVQNADRSKHGKQVIYDAQPRLDSRDLTLQFNIEGSSPDTYLAHFTHFVQLLRRGKVEVRVPQVSSDVFRLTYIDSATFALSENRTFSTLAVKFNEPNPADREPSA